MSETQQTVDIECPYKTLSDLWEARSGENPDKVFLYFSDKPYTYKETRDTISKFASALDAKGFKRGNLAILVPNSPEFLFAYFGAMAAGGTAATLNTLLKADELDFIINDCDAEFLITTPHYYKMLGPVLDKLTNIKHFIFTGDEVPAGAKNGMLFEDLVASGDAGFQTEIKGSDRAELIYTSGTTGHPKGVMLSHSNILYNSYVAPRMIDLQKDDVSLCIMPLFHVNAQIASTIATLQAGATMVLEEMFKPRSFIKTLKKYKCTTFSGVPTIYNYLNDMKEAQGEDLSFLKACICGAAPMPVEVFTTFEQKFNAKIIEGYGLSEGTCVSSLNPLMGERKIGSIGVPIAGQEMAVWDDDGNPLPDGEIGEIVIKGPNVMMGYYNNPDATESAVIDGWLRTGDQGYRDQDGYYFISGRKKEMIIRGGENIYPKEIEEVLYEHEAVAEAAVVGLPDKKYGEEVAAFILPKNGASVTEKEIKAYLRQKIADYKRPRIIELVHELPKTATGKIQKVKIVEEHAGNQKLISFVKGKVHIDYKWVYGPALFKFYQGLKNKKFFGTVCPNCKGVQIPPKGYCGPCWEKCEEFVELPNEGILDSYTTVHMEFPGQPKKPPYTYGYIRLKGSHTHLYHIIGEGDMDDKVQVGTKVRAVWNEERSGNLFDIAYFEPID